MKLVSRISGCLLVALSLVGAAFAQNNYLPSLPVNPPYVQFDRSSPEGAPAIPAEPAGTTTYNAGTNVFSMTGVPNNVIFVNPTNVKPFCGASCVSDQILSANNPVDNNGNLLGGNPNPGLPDLVLNGQVTDGSNTYISPLLTGQIQQVFYSGPTSTPSTFGSYVLR